jgi:hypothetical protein
VDARGRWGSDRILRTDEEIGVDICRGGECVENKRGEQVPEQGVELMERQ